MNTMKKLRNSKNFSIIDIQNILNDLRYTKKSMIAIGQLITFIGV